MNAKIEQHAARLVSLEGKVAVVTGAASGIGRGIALLLAQMGASVALLDIDQAKGEATAAEIRNQSREAIYITCDVRSAADCRNAVEAVIKKWNKIDILCNCAGIAIRKDVVDLTEEEWDRALDVTLKGIYLLSREVIPHMIRAGGGSIINIGSGWSSKAARALRPTALPKAESSTSRAPWPSTMASTTSA